MARCRTTSATRRSGSPSQRVRGEQIPGAFAELGVWRGVTSAFLHRLAPERTLYLFDTFAGFPDADLPPGAHDLRFRDTSEAAVRARVGASDNVVLRPGYVPDTLGGLEDERFAFVLLDLDLHDPTLAVARVLLSAGPGRAATSCMHDYNNPESDWACKRAFDAFLADKPERVVELGDMWGSALIRAPGLTVRILHLTPELPYEPGGGGGRTREFFLCKRLADLGHAGAEPLAGAAARGAARRLAARRRAWRTGSCAAPPTPLEEVARARGGGARGARRRASRARCARWRCACSGRACARSRERAVREWRPDVVVVGHDMAAAWARDLPRELPAVLTLHNLTWHWYLSRARLASGAHALALRAEAARYRRHVLRVLPRFHTAVAVSTLEARRGARARPDARRADPDGRRHRAAAAGARAARRRRRGCCSRAR